MDDAAAVGVGDGLTEPDEAGHEAQALVEAGFVGGGAQVVPADLLHRVVERAVEAAADLVHGHDAGVFEQTGDAGFVEEAGLDDGAVGAAVEDGAEALERDLAAEVAIVDAVDEADAAFAEHAAELVAAGVLSGELFVVGAAERGEQVLRGGAGYGGGAAGGGGRGAVGGGGVAGGGFGGAGVGGGHGGGFEGAVAVAGAPEGSSGAVVTEPSRLRWVGAPGMGAG
ncbi:MAG: hypothetical protein H6703_11935 [Myxococcales bacterium]|nr:hypothetical protein [Myxococcales bacterium]